MSRKILLESVKLGDLTLPNKIIMPALTRCRADYNTGIPTDLHADYYSQRAAAGLIVSESLWIHPMAYNQPGACGLYNKDHVKGWQKVTKAIHDKGGKIFCQPFHCGRAGHPENFGGRKPLAPSPVPFEDGSMFFTGKEKKVYAEPPQEMTKSDIQEVLDLMENSAKLAVEAGFDGFELHSGGGCLYNQFYDEHTNRRTDEYGGSIENRCRLTLETIDRFIKIWGAGRIGIKISPVGRHLDMYNKDPLTFYGYLCQKLTERKIACVCFKEYDGTSKPRRGGLGSDQIANCAKAFRPSVGVGLMTSGFLDFAEGERRVRDGEADVVAYGRDYIPNPDLVERYKNDWPIEKYDRNVFYTPGPKGYTDYPTYKENQTKTGGSVGLENTIDNF